MQGTVKSFNPEKGFGFITSADGSRMIKTYGRARLSLSLSLSLYCLPIHFTNSLHHSLRLTSSSTDSNASTAARRRSPHAESKVDL